jgi:23S rRNA pseudoU1915 N3-methylase RlmH
MKYTVAQKRDIADQLIALDRKEQEDVFIILSRHNIAFSSNGNGIFVNMKNIKANVLKEIESYIQCAAEKRLRLAQLSEENEKMKTEAEEIQQQIDQQLNQNLPEEQQISIPDTTYKQFEQRLLDDKHLNSTKSGGMKRFLVAKKKYAKPSVSDTRKDEFHTVLDKELYLL